MKAEQQKTEKMEDLHCYHCGETCKEEIIHHDDKNFCCEGCSLVYDLLKDNSLCTYYNLNDAPGISPQENIHSWEFDYLNNEEVGSKLIRFRDGDQAHVTFYVPKIHCSSCIWLLENLHRINSNISASSVNFLRKEVTVVFNIREMKLSAVAALLSHIGYEPLIHLDDLEEKPEKTGNRAMIIKIGLAGFCFGNIMMLSFPEYFSIGNFQGQHNLSYFFGYLNLLLSLPVFFYCASGFFSSAWKSIRHRYLNIDAPIALAILVTFLRSVYEILSHTGTGYMDSMSGIVFFMLIGRYFQDKTYATLSFERDYKSYFPVGVTIRQKDGTESNQPVTDLKKGDIIIIRNNELIPSDAVLLKKSTHIDYSFITGESNPVKKQPGDLIYAGGKQLDGAAELEVLHPTSQSYLTQLWNKRDTRESGQTEKTFTDKINRYFTVAVLSIAAIALLYWLYADPSKALNAMTAVLIVACPCGLLLTATFANGNIMRFMGRNKFYLKNASVIETLTKADTVIFDKTGTITHGITVNFVGTGLSSYELQLAASLAAQSSHPLSRKIAAQYLKGPAEQVYEFEEIAGKGIRGYVDGTYVIMGSQQFVTGTASSGDDFFVKTFVMLDGEITGFFSFTNTYRSALKDLVQQLSADHTLKVLSGDNASEKQNLQKIFGTETELLFNNKPDDKMNVIRSLREKGHRVIMIGDGLNDAGALMESNVGIAVSDDTNNFSPACDAILDGSSFTRLADFIKFAKAGKKVIAVTFAISLVYNIIGLSFAVQGILSPVIAAILMPLSSISIVLLATVSTTLIAKRMKL